LITSSMRKILSRICFGRTIRLLNPKFEYRNPCLRRSACPPHEALGGGASRRQAKQILMTEIQMIKTVLNIWKFGFVSCFEFRASDLYFRSIITPLPDGTLIAERFSRDAGFSTVPDKKV